MEWSNAHGELDSSLGIIKSLPDTAAPDLRTRIDQAGMLPYSKIDQGEASNFDAGWRVERATIRIEDAPWTPFIRLLQETELSRPPWRLVSVEIRSEDLGRIDGSLELEVLCTGAE